MFWVVLIKIIMMTLSVLAALSNCKIVLEKIKSYRLCRNQTAKFRMGLLLDIIEACLAAFSLMVFSLFCLASEETGKTIWRICGIVNFFYIGLIWFSKPMLERIYGKNGIVQPENPSKNNIANLLFPHHIWEPILGDIEDDWVEKINAHGLRAANAWRLQQIIYAAAALLWDRIYQLIDRKRFSR